MASKRLSLTKKQQVEFSATYDYAIVFPCEGDTPEAKKEGKQTATSKYVINELNEHGLQTFCYLSVQKDELICLVRFPV
jgi:hypothetical protein